MFKVFLIFLVYLTVLSVKATEYKSVFELPIGMSIIVYFKGGTILHAEIKGVTTIRGNKVPVIEYSNNINNISSFNTSSSKDYYTIFNDDIIKIEYIPEQGTGAGNIVSNPSRSLEPGSQGRVTQPNSSAGSKPGSTSNSNIESPFAGSFQGILGSTLESGVQAGLAGVAVGVAAASTQKAYKDLMNAKNGVEVARKNFLSYMESVSKAGAESTANLTNSHANVGGVIDELDSILGSEEFTPITQDSLFTDKLLETWGKYKDFAPSTPQEGRLKKIGKELVKKADETHNDGNINEAKEILSFSTRLADALIGIDPFTNIPRGTYEFLVGKNFFTDEPLTLLERGFSGATVVMDIFTLGTAGTGIRVAAKSLQLTAKHAHGIRGVGQGVAAAGEKAAEITNHIDKLITGRNGLLYKDMRAVNLQDANRGFLETPWNNVRGPIIEGVAKEPLTAFRFYLEGQTSPVSQWVVRGGLEGKTLNQIVEGLALPYYPNKIAVWEMPAGTKMRFGFANEAFEKGGGMMQHQVLTTPVLESGVALKPQMKVDSAVSNFLRVDGSFNEDLLRGLINRRN